MSANLLVLPITMSLLDRSHHSVATALCLFACLITSPYAGSDDHAVAWSDRPVTRPFDNSGLEPLAGTLSQQDLQRLINEGERLFTHRFTAAEGGVRPLATQAILPTKRKRPPRSEFARTAGMDANACASCHHVPVVGGAGDFSANVFVSEGFRQADFDTTDPQFSNERNTNHLFGAGLVELLAREMSASLQQQRSQALAKSRENQQTLSVDLIAKGVSFGSLTAHPDGRVDTRKVDGVDQDLVVRPFSHKGVMTSLRQFTVNALNHHHGIQAAERFGPRWTDDPDFDGDGLEHEIGKVGVSALVAWQASLPPPVRRVPTVDKLGRDINPSVQMSWQAAAERGEQRFEALGCTSCHRPSLPLDSLVFADPGPVDAAGTLRRSESPQWNYDLSLIPAINALPRDAQGRVLVPLYGDLKRHRISDRQVATFGNELLSQRFVDRNVFQTTELWGVGSTAPYGHRGDLTTLTEAIDAHGGDARESRDAWIEADSETRDDVLAFLKSLRILP